MVIISGVTRPGRDPMHLPNYPHDHLLMGGEEHYMVHGSGGKQYSRKRVTYKVSDQH